MTIDELITDPAGTLVRLDATGTGAEDQYGNEVTHALLFRRENCDPEFVEDELEVWLETAEDEEANEDLVIIGCHPTDEHLQFERLFYQKKSLGPEGPVFSLDVDGTAVPGTFREFAPSLSCFKPE